MKALILRDTHGKDHTFSKLHLDNEYQCEGIEDEYRAIKVKGETRVPEGIYPLKCRVSPSFSKYFYSHPTTYELITREEYQRNPGKYSGYTPHELIWIDPIPGFQFVLLHWGNTDDDTEGCYIVGTARGLISGQPAVTSSKAAYMRVYPKIMRAIKSGEPCTVEYKSINFNPAYINNLVEA